MLFFIFGILKPLAIVEVMDLPIRIKDRLILSAFNGGISAIIANLFLYSVNAFLHGYTINMPETTAEFFIKINPDHIGFLTRALGFMWSMIVGGFYALLYIISLELTGWDYMVIKALIVVSGGWLIGVGLTMKLLSVAHYTRNEPVSIAAFFVAHLVFATSLGLMTKKIGVK